MEVEKRSSKGGFLQLFDWNVKSRKKLFSDKSDLSEGSKQGKENVDRLAMSQLQKMKLNENVPGPVLRGSDYASSVSNEEGCGIKAPGVVARLMGLDSLPTSHTSEPSFTSFIDSHSFRDTYHPRIASEFESEHHAIDYDMRNKLDGFSRNPAEARLQKLQNRPIERFQTEILPPKSAKSVPITHHRLLSPIKSPGFILTRNAAYIMEAAAKIIEQSPQSSLNGKLPSFGSSSIPLRIRDLKEKMEAAQRTSRLPEVCQRPKEGSSIKSLRSQPHENSQSGSEVVVSKQGGSQSLKNKDKSVSLATQAKDNLQRREGTTSRNNRSIMNQKDDVDVKSGHCDKKQRNTPKSVQRTSTGRTSDVFRQNNKKQNCSSSKDRLSLKPKVPYQQDRKASSRNGSFKESKTSNKTVENSEIGSRKVNSVTAETGKEFSSSNTKTFSGKKCPVDRNIVFDGSAAENVLIREKERSVKCNITIDGCTNWDAVDRKNGMDVVSFTFNSPIKKSLPGSHPSGQTEAKCRSLHLDPHDDRTELKTSNIPSLGVNVINSEALSVLLEQKLKQLTCRVGSSQSPPSSASTLPNLVPSFDVVNTMSVEHEKKFYLSLQKDKSGIQHDFDFSSVDRLLIGAEKKWQGVKVMEGLCSTSEKNEYGKELDYQQPSTIPSLEPSFSDGSCISSDSQTTFTTNGSKQHLQSEAHDMSTSTSPKQIEVLEGETELQDSASSYAASSAYVGSIGRKVIATTTSEYTTIPRSSNWRLEYVREVLGNAELPLEDFALGQAQKVIPVNLFDQLENQKTGTDKNKLERKVLFECVDDCVEASRERAFRGSCREWVKWTTLFSRKELLADEIYSEICGWTIMEDLMVDELVDKDMSTKYGKWVDFQIEALEERVAVENGILTSLMDELVSDLLFALKPLSLF